MARASGSAQRDDGHSDEEVWLNDRDQDSRSDDVSQGTDHHTHRIMNRFSKDMDTVDNTLSDAMRMMIGTLGNIIGYDPSQRRRVEEPLRGKHDPFDGIVE
jgi:flagellar biosynthesis regulator FlaF